MSVEDADKKIKEDIKEFFAVRNLEEAEEYFGSLPTEHRWLLVDKLVSEAMERKEADAHLVAEFFELAASKELCLAAAFEDGFAPTVGGLDDLAIDVPLAFHLMAVMMKGAGLDQDEERRTRLASKLLDSDKLLALLS
jgi:translation initiation factor 4G